MIIDALDRLTQLAEWHQSMGTHPVDVSGSDQTRAARKRFHCQAAIDIRNAVTELKQEKDDENGGDQ